jgi:hypothetical protein
MRITVRLPFISVNTEMEIFFYASLGMLVCVRTYNGKYPF